MKNWICLFSSLSVAVWMGGCNRSSTEGTLDANCKVNADCDAGMYCDATGQCQAYSPDQCCGSDCANCEAKAHVCDQATNVCVPLACGSDQDCKTAGYVCNTQWGFCVVADCAEKPDFTRCKKTTLPELSYDICVGGECISPGCGDATCNVPGPHFTLADTGQKSCYDWGVLVECPSDEQGDFYGQDAQYGWDRDYIMTPRFSRDDTDEPVVKDNVTGLFWQGCAAGLSGQDNHGTALEGRNRIPNMIVLALR